MEGLDKIPQINQNIMAFLNEPHMDVAGKIMPSFFDWTSHEGAWEESAPLTVWHRPYISFHWKLISLNINIFKVSLSSTLVM